MPMSYPAVTRPALLGAFALAVALTACGDQKVASASTAGSAAPADLTLPDPLATVGGTKVTMADVRARVGDRLDENETRYRVSQHKILDGAVQEIVRERVFAEEARKQGKTVDQLLAAEVGGSLEPSEVEIAAWYNENQERVRGRALPTISAEIGNYLRQQRRADANDKLEARLFAQSGVKVNLEPYRLTFDNAKAPALGSANAPVTLVEFSDFECPFCGRFYPTLKRIEETYGDRVRIVYRQFPLTSIHANAFKAAEASLCANEQGKFWPMHDLLFQEQQGLSVRDLKVKAGRVGVDQAKFDQCLETGRYAEQVQNDVREGTRVGVNGTPALFVNGVSIEGGAVPFEVLKKAIDKELAAAGAK